MAETTNGGSESNSNSELRMYGEYYGVAQEKDETDKAYRSRLAGELRRRGKIIEAHEIASGRRWDDPEQGPTGPMAGIYGAIAQTMQGFEYSPYDSERQVEDDIAAGVVVMQPRDRSGEAILALFDLAGPDAAMEVLDSFARRPED